jgi:addiction module RelE/StbE family toxin
MKRPVERKTRFAVSPVYKESWLKYLKVYPNLRTALTEFNRAKRKIPPTRLPDKMRDHVLDGPLKGVRECHLESDVLLLYTHKSDLVHLLLVCEHADLKGRRGRELATTIRRILK